MLPCWGLVRRNPPGRRVGRSACSSSNGNGAALELAEAGRTSTITSSGRSIPILQPIGPVPWPIGNRICSPSRHRPQTAQAILWCTAWDPAPSAIWRGDVLMRCGTCLISRAGSGTRQTAMPNRVVLDGVDRFQLHQPSADLPVLQMQLEQRTTPTRARSVPRALAQGTVIGLRIRSHQEEHRQRHFRQGQQAGGPASRIPRPCPWR